MRLRDRSGYSRMISMGAEEVVVVLAVESRSEDELPLSPANRRHPTKNATESSSHRFGQVHLLHNGKHNTQSAIVEGLWIPAHLTLLSWAKGMKMSMSWARLLAQMRRVRG